VSRLTVGWECEDMIAKACMFWMSRSVQLAIGLFLLLGQSAIGHEANVQAAEITSASEVLSLKQNASEPTTLDQELEQITQAVDQAAIAEITGIRLDTTEGALGLILETSGELFPATSVIGNALIVEISNAVLTLPDRDEFLASDPVAGIAQVNITNLPGNRVRVVMTGTDAPPKIEVISESSMLTLSVTPETSTAGTGADDSIQIVVTGEQEEYFVPEASTATGTDTPVLDVPASIQVIPREVLEDQQVIRLDEALNNVSGVTTAGTSGNTNLNFNIRGFDNAPVLLDGFRDFGGFEGSIPETANLERIEVLKGPASILYGEIQPGGVINLVREQPLAEPFYQFGLLAGNRGLFQPQMDISGPLTSDGRLLYRLNALYQHNGGFTNFDQEYARAFVAPALSWQIGERTDLNAYVEYTNEQAPLDNGLVASGTGVVDVPFERIIGEPDDFTDSEFLNLGYDLEHRFNDDWQIRNAFRYTNRDLLDVGAIPFGFDEATGIVTRFAGEQNFDTENYSLQTHVVGEFATGSIDHTLLFGVDLNRTNDKNVTRLDTSTPLPLNIFNPDYGAFADVSLDNLPLAFNVDTQTNRLGVYLQDQIEFLDNLILLAGIRYDTVEQTTVNYPAAFAPNRSETTQNDQAWTPRFGLVYQPIPEVSLYASYSQSFTPNTARTSAGDPLAPERGEGYEVGAKAELLDGDLLVTLAYFDITRQNVATPDPGDPFSSVATGEQRSRGVELDVVGEILPGWNVIVTYAYIDAEVTDDNSIPEGNRLFNAPEHSASLWTTYEIQRGNLQGLGFGIGFDVVGEREGDLSNSFQVDNYFLTNAAVYYRRSNWRFAVNVKNLFDIDYISATQNSRTSGIEPGAPLSVIGSISVEF